MAVARAASRLGIALRDHRFGPEVDIAVRVLLVGRAPLPAVANRAAKLAGVVRHGRVRRQYGIAPHARFGPGPCRRGTRRPVLTPSSGTTICRNCTSKGSPSLRCAAWICRHGLKEVLLDRRRDKQGK